MRFVAVAPIVADVRERGDAAVREWTDRPDGERADLDLASTRSASLRPGWTTTCSRRSGG